MLGIILFGFNVKGDCMKKLLILTALIVFTLLLTSNYKTFADYGYSSGSYSNSSSGKNDNWKEDKTVELVANNIIRKATPAEIQNWQNLATKNGYPLSSDIMVDFTYVAQRSFVIPDDFCYGHFINFIIPNGVDPPANKQNCGFFLMKDGSHL